jgi:hypothetical protein
MAFTTDLLERVPWNAFGITEDGEYHLSIVAAGERVAFAPDASVTQPMPTSFRGSEVQQARWEQGRLTLALQRAPRLMAAGIGERDLVKVHAAFEVAVPPQTILFGVGSVVAATARALGHRSAWRLAAAALAGQAAFALGGLVLVRAPARAYASLALAPLLAVRKAALMLRVASRRTPPKWVRAPRD